MVDDLARDVSGNVKGDVEQDAIQKQKVTEGEPPKDGKAPASGSGIKACRYCGSEIAAAAAICPSCKYSQSPLRNLLVFWAGITGFLTLMASGFAFVAGKATDLYKAWTWKDDVHVVSLVTGLMPKFSVVVSNVGSGPVFVSDLVINWRGNNAAFYINEKLNSGEFLRSHDGGVPPDYDVFVSSRSGKPSSGVLENAAPDAETDADKHCFLTVFYLPDSSDIERMEGYYRARGRSLAVDLATGRLTFFSQRSKAKLQAEFPVLVTYVRAPMERCKSIPFD